jgi:hypothetical protein
MRCSQYFQRGGRARDDDFSAENQRANQLNRFESSLRLSPNNFRSSNLAEFVIPPDARAAFDAETVAIAGQEIDKPINSTTRC